LRDSQQLAFPLYFLPSSRNHFIAGAADACSKGLRCWYSYVRIVPLLACTVAAKFVAPCSCFWQRGKRGRGSEGEIAREGEEKKDSCKGGVPGIYSPVS
jgi:hypothetical protein